MKRADDTGDAPVQLLEEFPPVSTEQWEETIRKDLKGRNYAEKLIWKTYEGIAVRPYYRRVDLQSLAYLAENNPGELPYARGPHKAVNEWAVREEILAGELEIANRDARRALERGATEIGFVTRVTGEGIQGQPVQNQADMDQLLEGIDLEHTAVHFDWGPQCPEALALFSNVVAARGTAPNKVTGSFLFDPLGSLARNGSWPGSANEMKRVTTAMLRFSEKELPHVRPLVIQSHPYHDAGASIVQELAFVLSAAVEYLDQLSDAGLGVERIARRMGFSFSVASNYFLEIARLRAARLLGSSLLTAFGAKESDTPRMYVHAKTSAWNKTIYDPNVNMLRTTTEAMSAVIGGCDSLSVTPFDAPFRTPDEFSCRVARNTQLVLKHEAALEKSVDPSAGSYYIEHLTDALAGEAWKLFLRIEDKGGYLAALQTGYIQEQIAEIAEKRKKNIFSRKDMFLGTNQYPNPDERMLDRIVPAETIALEGDGVSVDVPWEYSIEDLKAAFLSGASLRRVLSGRNAAQGTLSVAAVPASRGPEPFEQIRLATERYEKQKGQAPRVFLWTAGDRAMRLARASFAANFFGCAGFRVIDNPGFENIAEGLAAVAHEDPHIVVLCSSDAEYLEMAGAVCAALKDKAPEAIRVVAGYPLDHIDALRAAGVDDFVHLKTDAAEFLVRCQERLGVSS